MYDTYMPVDQVDETAQNTGMQPTSGYASRIGLSSPTKSLVVFWFFVLAVYWFTGWFFRGASA